MIINKSKTLTMLVMAFLLKISVQAQSIHFNYSDYTKSSYNLKDIRKITFENDLMNLHLHDGSIYAWNVSTIKYYQYDESILSVQELINDANEWAILVYPNPANSSINIKFNLKNEDDINITLYDLQGSLILEKKLGTLLTGEHLVSFDINNIAVGTYIFRLSGKKQSVSKKIIKDK